MTDFRIGFLCGVFAPIAIVAVIGLLPALVVWVCWAIKLTASLGCNPF